MLFEREELTPQGRLEVLARLFGQAAARPGACPEPGRVPVETLHAYGEFEKHVRYLLEAAASQQNTMYRKARLKKLERTLNTLPDELMASLPAGPGENWLRFYRALMRFLEQMDEAQMALDEEEYTTVIRKMIHLAASVSDASAVRVDAASMFALMLMQMELLRLSRPKKQKKRKRRRKKPAKAQ